MIYIYCSGKRTIVAPSNVSITIQKNHKSTLKVILFSTGKATLCSLNRISVGDAELQKQEYENVTERIQKDKMRREAETLEEERKRKDHLASLQSQIQYKQQYAKDHFQDKQIEGQKLREEYDAELEKLEQLRAKEIQKLEAKGVNPKYLSEMKSLDLAKIRNC